MPCQHITQSTARKLTFIPKVVEIRAMPAAFDKPGRSYQRWYEDMLNFNWNTAKNASQRLVNGGNVEAWADNFFDAILQANANSHWIGRDLVSLDPTTFEELDILAARAIADDDAEYLQGFIDDILDGRYTDEAGDLMLDQILNRQKLYMGKARGISAQASVDNLDLETEITWVLGGAEKHCSDCPRLASISPYFKDDLFTTPGACDTPCLGNCKCHLEFEVGGQKVQTIKPVVLEND